MNSISENPSPSPWAKEPYIIAAARRSSSWLMRRVRSIMSSCWSIVLRTIRLSFRAAILAPRSIQSGGTDARSGPAALPKLVAVLVAGRALEVVCVFVKSHALETQRLDESDGGDVAGVYLRRGHAHPIILEKMREQATTRFSGEAPPLIRHEDHVGDCSCQVFVYGGLENTGIVA